MRQAEIWDVNFNPTMGQEQSGIRPSVIVSGNIMNKNYDLVIVCPISSKVKNLRGNVILTPNDQNGLRSKSEILVFHIKSISKKRLVHKRGQVSKDQLDEIIMNLNKVLTY